MENTGVKVTWKNVIKETTIFQMVGMRYKLIGTLIAVGQNGGLIAITLDKSNPLPSADKELSDNVVIHNSRGELVNKIQMFDIIVALEFIESTQLAIIFQNGTYFLYNPQTGSLSKKRELGPQSEFESDPIFTAKIAGGSTITYMTRSYSVFVKNLLDNSPAIRLFETKTQLDINALNYSVIPEGDITPLQLFIPITGSGVLQIFHSQEGEDRNEMILDYVKEEIRYTSISPAGQNLAVLTKSGLLIVVSSKLSSSKWTKQLEIDEGEMAQFQKLEWVGYHGVALVFTKNIKYACCGVKEDYFEANPDPLVSRGRTAYLITKSEIDGLRIIRIFDRSKEQNCSMTRRNPQAYSNVTGYDDAKPGHILYHQYLASLAKEPFEKGDIRANEESLLTAVSDLVECGCFEFDRVIEV